MKRLLLLFSGLSVLLLAACTAGGPAQQPAAESDGPVVTVYRAPT